MTMSNDTDPIFTPGELIGDYLIDDRISIGTNTSTWLATQVSVQRDVILCVLDATHSEDQELRQEFISDVRAKASVNHPLIASVLEAVNEGSLCYYAVEKLTGKSLGDLHEQDSSIAPYQAARIIRNTSGACNYLEINNINAISLTPHDIFVDDNYHCRVANLAISGKLDQATATRDKEMVGCLIQDMVEPNKPGSTRTNALLAYMADLKRNQPLSWSKIHDLSAEIERQLARPSEHGQIKSPTMKLDSTSFRYLYLSSSPVKIIVAIIILSIIGGLAYHTVYRVLPTKKRQLADMIHIPAGKYPGPNGVHVKIQGFWMDAHEVTIGEYAEFLELINELGNNVQTVYEHPDQPSDKTSHEPDDWEKLYAAAKQGGIWNNLKVDLNYPVVGVDWWDAHAYAEWKSRQLPTYEEWYVACSSGSDPEKLAGTGWKPVDQAEATALGLQGMAGNVSEWVREKTLDPADPSQPPRFVISGASYMRPKFGARAREWVKNRSLRRPDLGFRTYSNRRQED